MTHTPRIAVVDQDNRFLRWTDRAEIHAHHLPHRSVQVAIFDSQGRLVLQQRHPDKLTYPGCWDLSCSGHVEEDDYHAGPDDDLDRVYLHVAHRELREELGIDTDLTLLAAFPPQEGVHYEHTRLYLGYHDGPFTPQPTEVAQIQAFTPEARDRLEPTTRSLRAFDRWLRQHHLP